MTTSLFANFGQVRIINLVDRPDRRQEMTAQLTGLGAMSDNVAFFDAHRPSQRGEFTSIGARGCFESHLSILKDARQSGPHDILLLEDDFDFSSAGCRHARELMNDLVTEDWDIFYGAHVMPTRGRHGLVALGPDEPVITASFVAFRRRVLDPMIDFLEAMLLRPAGSADFGPMHVDGAYTVFRAGHPEYRTLAAFPSFGHQRSSRSDITPSNMILDRWKLTKPIGTILRRGYNWTLRR